MIHQYAVAPVGINMIASHVGSDQYGQKEHVDLCGLAGYRVVVPGL